MIDFGVHSVNFQAGYRDLDPENLGKYKTTWITKNTWEDFHLVPASLPIVAAPTVKTNYIDIPGGDGALDCSTSLTGFPLYQNRTGDFKFDLLDENYFPIKDKQRWSEVYSDLLDFFHGNQLRCFLQDDPSYYYEGRFAVKGWESGQKPSRITIEYSLKPYKISWISTADNWEWDPFRFPGGIIRNGMFNNLTFGETETRYDFGMDDESIVGTRAVRPMVKISTDDHLGAYVKVLNHRYPVDLTNAYPDEPYEDGEFPRNGIVLAGGWFSLFCKTGRSGINGSISLIYNPGRL